MLHPDQYRFGIKSPVLLYSSNSTNSRFYDSTNSRFTIRQTHDLRSQKLTQSIKTQDSNNDITTINLETALCYQHYFCNTELRTTIITEIKGLSIQTQQNRFVLFTLFKSTLDERKTLRKIPTRKTSHNHSPKQAQASNDKRSKETSKQGKEQSSIKRRKRPFATEVEKSEPSIEVEVMEPRRSKRNKKQTQFFGSPLLYRVTYHLTPRFVPELLQHLSDTMETLHDRYSGTVEF